jgi:predicted RNA-binding Zn ribbon-like protein
LADVEQAGRQFDLSGGALCLDFANTLDDRPAPRPNESLQSYDDLLAFARQTGALADAHLDRLRAASARRPADAAAALDRALALREAIYRLFLALADGDPAPSEDLAALNRALAEALAQARVADASPAEADRASAHRVHVQASDGVGRSPGRFTWTWADEPLHLEMPLWPVARSAAELLTSSDLSAPRVCASASCAWLFLDTSRNGSRRWCSMRTCGNRAKARRHHARVRAAAAATGES